MTKDEVIEAIERERERLFAAVDAMGDGATTVAVTAEGWTAKDVLAHCIHWAGQLAHALGAPTQPPAYIFGVEGRPSGEEWNAIAVAYHADKTITVVRAELDEIIGEIVERVRQRDDAAMVAAGAISWSPQRILWEAIGGETFLHWPRHVVDIEAATPG